MKINEMIRVKRTALGMTQEQVASYLGVSAPAVYKWEKGISYPDITLLPALARLLHTDLNTLLSFHADLTQPEISCFLEELVADAKECGVEHAFAHARDKIREYPSSDRLLLCVALTLDGITALGAGEEGARRQEELESLYQRAAESTDPQVSSQAKTMLIARSMQRDELDRAEQLLTELPEEGHSPKNQLKIGLLMRRERWEAAGQLLEQKLLTDVSGVQNALFLLMELAVREGRGADAAQIAGVAGELVHLFELWEGGCYIAQFQLAVLQKDVDQCVGILQKLLSTMEENWRLADSPLYRHTPAKENQEHLGYLLLPQLLSELEDPAHPEYEFLRGDTAYQRLMQSYRRQHGGCSC